MQRPAQITVLLALAATAVFYCLGATTVSFIKPVAANAMGLLPTVALVSLAAGTALGSWLAPRLVDQAPVAAAARRIRARR
ncbi:putative membrane protein YfcA [Amorphus suaedae]